MKTLTKTLSPDYFNVMEYSSYKDFNGNLFYYFFFQVSFFSLGFETMKQ